MNALNIAYKKQLKARQERIKGLKVNKSLDVPEFQPLWLCLLFHLLDEHVRNHDSPQWYDIVYFEHKLSWLYFGLSTNVRLTANNPQQSSPRTKYTISLP